MKKLYLGLFGIGAGLPPAAQDASCSLTLVNDGSTSEFTVEWDRIDMLTEIALDGGYWGPPSEADKDNHLGCFFPKLLDPGTTYPQPFDYDIRGENHGDPYWYRLEGVAVTAAVR